MDLETALLGLPTAKLLRLPCIFDIVDPFSQTKINLKLFDYIEVIYSRFSNLTMVPHTSRIDYYKDRINMSLSDTTIVIENVPNFPNTRTEKDGATNLTGDPHAIRKFVTIGYFGTLDRKNRGLENLVKMAERDSRIRLIIGGNGALYDYFQSYSGAAMIKFIGTYNQSELSDLFNQIDFSWAYYSPDLLLHKYAAPNKYYEHLYFMKPIIVSEIIPQSLFISKNRTGIVLKELNDESIYEKCYTYLKNTRWTHDFWKTNYENYWTQARIRLNKIIITKEKSL